MRVDVDRTPVGAGTRGRGDDTAGGVVGIADARCPALPSRPTAELGARVRDLARTDHHRLAVWCGAGVLELDFSRSAGDAT